MKVDVSDLPCGRNAFTDCPFWECCAWGQREYIDIPVTSKDMSAPAPPPTELNRNGNPRLNPAFSEWMMGWPAGWVTEVPGVSRNDQLKIVGNGVVPQQASAALAWLLQACEIAA